jgi:hypothetical protein
MTKAIPEMPKDWAPTVGYADFLSKRVPVRSPLDLLVSVIPHEAPPTDGIPPDGPGVPDHHSAAERTQDNRGEQ